MLILTPYYKYLFSLTMNIIVSNCTCKMKFDFLLYTEWGVAPVLMPLTVPGL